MHYYTKTASEMLLQDMVNARPHLAGYLNYVALKTASEGPAFKARELASLEYRIARCLDIASKCASEYALKCAAAKLKGKRVPDKEARRRRQEAQAQAAEARAKFEAVKSQNPDDLVVATRKGEVVNATALGGEVITPKHGDPILIVPNRKPIQLAPLPVNTNASALNFTVGGTQQLQRDLNMTASQFKKQQRATGVLSMQPGDTVASAKERLLNELQKQKIKGTAAVGVGIQGESLADKPNSYRRKAKKGKVVRQGIVDQLIGKAQAEAIAYNEANPMTYNVVKQQQQREASASRISARVKELVAERQAAADAAYRRNRSAINADYANRKNAINEAHRARTQTADNAFKSIRDRLNAGFEKRMSAIDSANVSRRNRLKQITRLMNAKNRKNLLLSLAGTAAGTAGLIGGLEAFN